MRSLYLTLLGRGLVTSLVAAGVVILILLFLREQSKSQRSLLLNLTGLLKTSQEMLDKQIM